jgi:RNA polymerase sigma-70 factor, ECF subfamily
MVRDRDNDEWIRSLESQGPIRESALADLRELLVVGLKSSLKSRSDYLENMLDDFLQDALIRILQALDQFQNRSRFVTWATAIAIRVAMTELRKRRWRDVSLDKLVADTNFDPVSDVDGDSVPERRELVETMYRVINTQLTEKQRTVLLAEIKGMAQEEIAGQMGCSRNALYKLSHDARFRLKQELVQAGFDSQSYAVAFNE